MSRLTSSFTCHLICIITTLIIHHSFTLTPGSKPTFSTNPSHLRLLLSTGLPSSGSFLLHVKYTLSYRTGRTAATVVSSVHSIRSLTPASHRALRSVNFRRICSDKQCQIELLRRLHASPANLRPIVRPFAAESSQNAPLNSTVRCSSLRGRIRRNEPIITIQRDRLLRARLDRCRLHIDNQNDVHTGVNHVRVLNFLTFCRCFSTPNPLTTTIVCKRASFCHGMTC